MAYVVKTAAISIIVNIVSSKGPTVAGAVARTTSWSLENFQDRSGWLAAGGGSRRAERASND
jgi:hypothetical protein